MPTSTPHHALYRQPEKYEAIAGMRAIDLHFYLFEAFRTKGPILEIGSGTGRVSVFLASFGVSVTGIEASSEMLAFARKRARKAKRSVRWIQADSRTFSLRRKFGLICIPFHPCSEYQTWADWKNLLGRAREHLKAGGRLTFDLANPGAHPYLKPAKFAAPSERATINRLSSLSAEERDNFRFSFLYPSEIRWILEGCGFEIEGFFGDFRRKPFEITDRYQVIVARRSS